MTTVLDAIVDALYAAGAYSKDDQVTPAAILWPDKEQQWEPFIPLLRDRLPILTNGSYNPTARTGPSYWLRCMVERTLPDDESERIPAGHVPIIYLPGVSKDEVRAIEEADQLFKPLAELQYRGALFTQKNGRDWTIAAFLQSADGGLGIETGADSGTKAAIRGARRVLADLSVEEMRRAAPLKAGYFNDKLLPGLERRLLDFLSDPPATGPQPRRKRGRHSGRSAGPPIASIRAATARCRWHVTSGSAHPTRGRWRGSASRSLPRSTPASPSAYVLPARSRRRAMRPRSGTSPAAGRRRTKRPRRPCVTP